MPRNIKSLQYNNIVLRTTFFPFLMINNSEKPFHLLHMETIADAFSKVHSTQHFKIINIFARRLKQDILIFLIQ